MMKPKFLLSLLAVGVCLSSCDDQVQTDALAATGRENAKLKKENIRLAAELKAVRADLDAAYKIGEQADGGVNRQPLYLTVHGLLESQIGRGMGLTLTLGLLKSLPELPNNPSFEEHIRMVRNDVSGFDAANRDIARSYEDGLRAPGVHPKRVEMMKSQKASVDRLTKEIAELSSVLPAPR